MSISISPSKATHSIVDLLGFENIKIARRVWGGNANCTKKATYEKKVHYYVHVKES